MDDNNKAPSEPPNRDTDIAALSEAINLAPIGVLPSKTILQLIDLRERIKAPLSTDTH